MRLLLSFFLLVVSSALHADQSLLVSAGGKLTRFSIDEKTGALSQTEQMDFGQSGVMTTSPDGKTIYFQTAIEDDEQGKKKPPAIATLRLNEKGELVEIHRAASSSSAGYLKTDAKGKFLAGSNYGSGNVSTWKIADDGVFRGDLIRTFDLERCAHSAFFSPDNKSLYVPATCPNKIFQLKFNEDTGEIVPRQPSSANGPADPQVAQQPRHLIFHPSKPLAYTTHERERPGAGVYSWDKESGTLELMQSIVTADSSDEEGMTTADLHLTPDAKFLYVSNRDIKNRRDLTLGRDSIAALAVDADTGRLSLIGRFPCPKVPRSFCLDSSGSFVFVGGQGDSLLASYRIDRKNGKLKEIGERIELPGSPSWVMCLSH